MGRAGTLTDVSTRDEDEAWRAIVENYGERPVLDADDARIDPSARDEQPSGPAFGPQPRPEATNESRPDPRPESRPEPRPEFRPFAGLPSEEPAELAPERADAEDTFVPPVPDLPHMERRRLIAWLAVLGAPAAFVLGAVADVTVTGTVAAVLALIFVAAIAWLVISMPREPRDPWDDGARV